MGIGTASPTLTLEVVGANDNGAVTGVDGVLVPRVNDTDMSTATDGTVDGQMVYNTVAKKFYYWNATAWTVVGGGPDFYMLDPNLETQFLSADLGNDVISTGRTAPQRDLDNITRSTDAPELLIYFLFLIASSGNTRSYKSSMENIGTKECMPTGGTGSTCCSCF